MSTVLIPYLILKMTERKRKRERKANKRKGWHVYVVLTKMCSNGAIEMGCGFECVAHRI